MTQPVVSTVVVDEPVVVQYGLNTYGWRGRREETGVGGIASFLHADWW